MNVRRMGFSGSLALTSFLGCSTGGVVVVHDAVPRQVVTQDVVPRHAVAQEVDDGYFYTSLAPHGRWFFQAQFGWVWHPTRVAAGWRPYTEGQWVWSDDEGWVWASYEPWGWATYHYGRWYFDPFYGWTWVPGRVWAPAWVSWRVERGYVGWAPLWPVYFDHHPEYRWDRWHHDHDWERRHHDRDWDRWVFCRDRDFASDRVGHFAIRDRYERDRVFRGSRDVTRWDSDRPERNTHSIDRAMIERASGRPVRHVRLDSADRPGSREEISGDRMRVFRPRVQEKPDKTPDRLGVAKEAPRDERQTDTLRNEKERLERMPGKGKAGTAGPTVRENDDERGAAPESIEREEGRGGGGARGGQNIEDRRPAAERETSGRGSGRGGAAGMEKVAPGEPGVPNEPGTDAGKPKGRNQESGAAADRGGRRIDDGRAEPRGSGTPAGPGPATDERNKPAQPRHEPTAPREPESPGHTQAPRHGQPPRVHPQQEKQERMQPEHGQPPRETPQHKPKPARPGREPSPEHEGHPSKKAPKADVPGEPPADPGTH